MLSPSGHRDRLGPCSPTATASHPKRSGSSSRSPKFLLPRVTLPAWMPGSAQPGLGVRTSPPPGSNPRSLQKKRLIKAVPAGEVPSESPAARAATDAATPASALGPGWLNHLPPPNTTRGSRVSAVPSRAKSNRTSKKQPSPYDGGWVLVQRPSWIPAGCATLLRARRGPTDRANCGMTD